MKRIGIMGGTFDPITFAHLFIAENARTEANLDHVLFVPNGHPPHKRNVGATPQQRWEMCSLALLPYDSFSLSDVEMANRDYYYTLTTLAELKRQYPHDQLCLIIGSDQALAFGTWSGYDNILSTAELIVAQRPTFEVNPIEFQREFPAAILTLLDGDFFVSSTLVRTRLAARRSIRFLTPDPVVDYIKEHGLYGSRNK
jgi:nicotinate-nucleotide adenylyltransferase